MINSFISTGRSSNKVFRFARRVSFWSLRTVVVMSFPMEADILVNSDRRAVCDDNEVGRLDDDDDSRGVVAVDVEEERRWSRCCWRSLWVSEGPNVDLEREDSMDDRNSWVRSLSDMVVMVCM